ncbi:MAG: phosphate ABC transporter ATP-binding protein [Synechococcales cyanobacterium RU_4_20]|nr:phosphate ABC transporter ATP-binding protein [Synechococcales cyanobacterium RU_4_20]
MLLQPRSAQLRSDCDAPPHLEVSQLALRYGRTRILENVDLSIPAGEITALIGPSGCGKTSFLNCLNRLIELSPQAQVSGQIQLNGRDVQQFPVMELRRQVGMLFQKPNPFPLSIYRNIAFPLREHGVCDRNEIDAIIETVLKDVGLWHEVKDRLKSPALSLSGGQQQRLCLARALALKPCVILMDEPCSALDPIASEIVEDLISQLKGDYTVVVVTHNLAQARRVADQVVLFWINDGVGQVVESGPTQQVFTDPQHPLTIAYVSGRRG